MKLLRTFTLFQVRRVNLLFEKFPDPITFHEANVQVVFAQQQNAINHCSLVKLSL